MILSVEKSAFQLQISMEGTLIKSKNGWEIIQTLGVWITLTRFAKNIFETFSKQYPTLFIWETFINIQSHFISPSKAIKRHF